MQILKLVFILSIVGSWGSAQADIISSSITLNYTGCTDLGTTDKAHSYDKSCIETYYDAHPMTQTSFLPWQEMIKKPIDERLVTVTQEMIEYMQLDNMLYDFPYDNIKAAQDPQLIAAAQKALRDLPVEMNQYIQDHFYGFMLVTGVGWTGFASSVLAVPELALKPGAVIIINADNMNGKTLNEWLAFREETTFDFFEDKSSYPQYSLEMAYQKPNEASTLEDNLRHFLIHETAHLIVNARPELHPAFKYRNSKPIPVSEFQKWQQPGQALEDTFSLLTFDWVLSSTTVPSTGETAFLASQKGNANMQSTLKQKKIKFYSTDHNSQFTLDEAFSLYQGLNETCFPSLYAMVDYSEDFAESVTHYFMNREGYHYSVRLQVQESAKTKEKVMTKFIDDMWSNTQCADKAQFIRDLFE